MIRTRPRAWAALVMAALVVGAAAPVLANGLGDSRSWQFDTSVDKANKSAALDLIERKKGGYYDGFNSYYTTNIGTQINCNNSANATGNIAENGQTGPTTVSNSNPNIGADSAGNVDSTAANSDGSSSTSGSALNGTQTNSGNVSSSVDDSNVSSGVSGVSNGNTRQSLNNNQDNSGNQDAGVSGSVACSLDGSTVAGAVDAPINGQ